MFGRVDLIIIETIEVNCPVNTEFTAALKLAMIIEVETVRLPKSVIRLNFLQENCSCKVLLSVR